MRWSHFWQTLVSRLFQGGVCLGLTLAILNFFPQIELATYDGVILQYRNLPRLFYWLNQGGGYSGLHRSITLIGDTRGAPPKDFFQTLSLCRERLAAGACWIAGEDLETPRPLRNETLESSPIFIEPAQSHVSVKQPDLPPLILKPSEPDGCIREYYLALKGKDNRLIPCLPLVLYSRFLGQSVCDPRFEDGQLWLEEHPIPVTVDVHGYTNFLIPYLNDNRTVDAASESWTSMADSMEPIHLEDVLQMKDLYLTDRTVARRFFFMGDYGMTAVGERTVSTGHFRDFQIAAMSLDTLIQGPIVRWVRGGPLVAYYLIVASGLAMWLLSPTSLVGRAFRFVQVAVTTVVFGLGALRLGYYFPLAWILAYQCLLTILILARIWLMTIGYLKRYGGSRAAQLLLQGQSDLDHSQVEERIVTIVFLGLPEHLRLLELGHDHQKTLLHRQIFSAKVAEITHRFDGLVHDFQADYLMLGFGTQPGRPDPDHPTKAFRAAQQLVSMRSYLYQAWLPEHDHSARVQVSLNSGMVAIGWVGTSRFKRASAAIGDTTNVAARLLGTAKKLDLDIIVSDTSYAFIQDQATFEALPPVKLKGKTDAVAIYKVLALHP